MAVDQVLAYEKMGSRYKRRYKPAHLHRTQQDCRHPSSTAIYRPATPEELRTLPECRTCADQEAKEALGQA